MIPNVAGCISPILLRLKTWERHGHDCTTSIISIARFDGKAMASTSLGLSHPTLARKLVEKSVQFYTVIRKEQSYQMFG